MSKLLPKIVSCVAAFGLLASVCVLSGCSNEKDTVDIRAMLDDKLSLNADKLFLNNDDIESLAASLKLTPEKIGSAYLGNYSYTIDSIENRENEGTVAVVTISTVDADSLKENFVKQSNEFLATVDAQKIVDDEAYRSSVEEQLGKVFLLCLGSGDDASVEASAADGEIQVNQQASSNASSDASSLNSKPEIKKTTFDVPVSKVDDHWVVTDETAFSEQIKIATYFSV